MHPCIDTSIHSAVGVLKRTHSAPTAVGQMAKIMGYQIPSICISNTQMQLFSEHIYSNHSWLDNGWKMLSVLLNKYLFPATLHVRDKETLFDPMTRWCRIDSSNSHSSPCGLHMIEVRVKIEDHAFEPILLNRTERALNNRLTN